VSLPVGVSVKLRNGDESEEPRLSMPPFGLATGERHSSHCAAIFRHVPLDSLNGHDAISHCHKYATQA
jgi:hypothetical protein